jgi:hypothetical protein
MSVDKMYMKGQPHEKEWGGGGYKLGHNFSDPQKYLSKERLSKQEERRHFCRI